MVDVFIGGGAVLVDGELREADVWCRDGLIAAVGALDAPAGAEAVDARGLIVAPGFVDAQLNGGWGHDFTSDPESIDAVAAELPATGVTTFLPTIVTAAPERRTAALAAHRSSRPRPGTASVGGLHFEGPMIAPGRVGAHDPAWVGAVDPAELATWTPAVRLVTLAPETPGALAAIRSLAAAGIVVSIGHTACSAGEFAAARSAGATAVTHLFNAMAPFSHRSPGPIGATLADPGVVAGMICDGIHADPVAVAMAWQALGPNRTLLVTDAMAALGLTSQTDDELCQTQHVMLGERRVTIGADGVRTAEGVLAGSNLAMDQAVRNLVAFTGCTAADALGCASRVPADLLGFSDRGRVEPGARADLVLLDDALHVQRTLIEGVTAWKS
ncbi:MAG TPA: N-acetylglucosamine-6-phosphate deacetylase [Ilumatobacter sp.]|nr:N-acetylglucosamine-6-phosphate deacetylase [Ilumatobacter sp.]